MLKFFPMLISFLVLPLAVQAKVPEQGAIFRLARVNSAGDEKKIAPEEVIPKGSKLRFRVEARKKPCTIVASAFLRGNAREVAALPPTAYRLQAEEQTSTDFMIDKPLRASDFFVVVVPQSSPTSEPLIDLVRKWKQSKNSQPARIALHDQLSHWLTSRDQSLNYSGPIPSELGGVRTTSARPANPTLKAPSAGGAASLEAKSREAGTGQSREWQNNADWISCTPDKPGVFIYRLGK